MLVYIILGKGFEEAEAVVPCDLLRRAGVDARFAGIGGREIAGGHGITVCADCVAEEADLSAADMIVLPGGLGGVNAILNCPAVLRAIQTLDQRGGRLAAICAGPTVLARLGITDGKNVTCYPGCESAMGSAISCTKQTVTDGQIITGQAPGAAFAFGLALVRALCGEQAAERVAADAVYG